MYSFVSDFFHPEYFKNSSMLLCVSESHLVFWEAVYCCMNYYNLFIHSYTDENVDCMQFLSMTNKAAMNNYTQVFV